MGSWGITMRQSDDGLDLLDLLILQQLKETDFAIFNVSEAIELLRQDILERIKKENQGCSPEDMDLYTELHLLPMTIHCAGCYTWPRSGS